MRCFVGITPPEDVLDVLETLSAEIPVGRIPPRGNFHITLAFLDEISESQAREVYAALADIRHPVVDIGFAGLDMFGGSQGKILHAAIRPDSLLTELHGKVMRRCRGIGLDLHRVRFRPHVTLARFNRAPKGTDADRLAAYLSDQLPGEIPGFEAREFSLFQSVLGHGPAQHHALARYDLGAPLPE